MKPPTALMHCISGRDNCTFSFPPAVGMSRCSLIWSVALSSFSTTPFSPSVSPAAFLGTLAVAACYALGRRLVGKRDAICRALVAVTFWTVSLSPDWLSSQHAAGALSPLAAGLLALPQPAGIDPVCGRRGATRFGAIHLYRGRHRPLVGVCPGHRLAQATLRAWANDRGASRSASDGPPGPCHSTPTGHRHGSAAPRLALSPARAVAAFSGTSCVAMC